MKSTAQKIDQSEGLIDTTDVSQWESAFLTSMVLGKDAGRNFSEKQLDILESIYNKHFA